MIGSYIALRKSHPKLARAIIAICALLIVVAIGWVVFIYNTMDRFKVVGILDLKGYCTSIGYQNVSLDGKTIHDWHCDDHQGTRHMIDFNAACRWQYPYISLVKARATDPNNAYSWQCYEPGP